jgi:hypothetical protein
MLLKNGSIHTCKTLHFSLQKFKEEKMKDNGQNANKFYNKNKKLLLLDSQNITCTTVPTFNLSQN